MHNLFQGLIEFKKHNYINLDIKDENILYDESENRMNFIDFGMSRPFSEVRSICRFGGYFTIPPECALITHRHIIFEKVNLEYIDCQSEALEKIMNEDKDNYNWFDETYRTPGTKHLYYRKDENKLKELLTNFITDKDKTTHDYLHKIGVFSMGIVLITLFKAYTNKTWPNPGITSFFDDLSDMIDMMIKPFYGDRYSPEQIYEHFEKLYAKYPIPLPEESNTDK